MTRTWIVVAGSARARIFRPIGEGKALELVQEMRHPNSRAHESELATDRPGRAFDSNGPGRHAMSPSVSPKENEALKFCKELADEIETARERGRVDRVVLVAAPSFLGELRKMLSEQTTRLVVYALDKNLAQMDKQDILQHLPDDIWP